MSATGVHWLTDWDTDMEVSLGQAVRAAMEVHNQTAEKVTRRLLAYMAQSASRVTRTASRRRPVEANPEFRHLVRAQQYKSLAAAGVDVGRYYMRLRAVKYTQRTPGQRFIYANEKSRISGIGWAGLAARSWMWGERPQHAHWPGVVEVDHVCRHVGDSREAGEYVEVGFLLTNRLSYINAAMPAGWQADVERRGLNRLLGYARHEVYAHMGPAMEATAQ